jgi:hypothetical protein
MRIPTIVYVSRSAPRADQIKRSVNATFPRWMLSHGGDGRRGGSVLMRSLGELLHRFPGRTAAPQHASVHPLAFRAGDEERQVNEVPRTRDRCDGWTRSAWDDSFTRGSAVIPHEMCARHSQVEVVAGGAIAASEPSHRSGSSGRLPVGQQGSQASYVAGSSTALRCANSDGHRSVSAHCK